MNHPDERDHHAHPGTSVPQVEKAEENGPLQRAAEAQEPASAPPQIDRRLLELLVCPLTKQTLDYDAAAQELISRAARLAFPIRDGIPIMLPEEARPLLDEPGR